MSVFHDPTVRKLGRKAIRHDPRTLRMATYLKTLPPLPDALPIPALAHLGMAENDVLGDCTAAEKTHDIQVWTARNGNEIVIPDVNTVKFYSLTTGYVLGDASTDQGGDMTTVLNGFRNTGLEDAASVFHKIGAFLEMERQNHDHVKASILLYGATSIAVDLPVSAQNQGVWTVALGGDQGDPTAGSWGGHDVCIVAYNATGPICITWGTFKQMTWDWFDAYCSQAFAMISEQDWINATTGTAPSGFDVAALQSDLAQVAA